jgi:hypothetical protein
MPSGRSAFNCNMDGEGHLGHGRQRAEGLVFCIAMG